MRFFGKINDKEVKWLKQIILFFLKYNFGLFLYILYYNSNISFSFLSYLSVFLINLIFKDEIIDYPSFVGKAYALYNEEMERIFVVDRDCLGINISLFLGVFIFSYPVKNLKIKERIIFFIISLLVIEFINLVRLTILYYFFIENYKTYIFLHEYFFQFFDLLIPVLFLKLYFSFITNS